MWRQCYGCYMLHRQRHESELKKFFSRVQPSTTLALDKINIFHFYRIIKKLFDNKLLMNNSVLWKVVPKQEVFILKWKWVVCRNAVSSRVALSWGRSSCPLMKQEHRNKIKVNYRGCYNLRQFEHRPNATRIMCDEVKVSIFRHDGATLFYYPQS